MFKNPTITQIKIVQDILKEHPSLIDVDRKFDADPWVIALALELANNSQKTLFTIKRLVVTEEKLRGDKVRIPFVCNRNSIESIDIITLFRIENWTF